MADDSNDKPSGAQVPTLGSSNDVLFGWLVRRAAADLGLAEAIAASEAQRNEHIHRLEESLLAKMHELRRQPDGAAQPAAAVDDLKTELRKLTARMATVESTAQQAGQTSESLKADLAVLGSHLGARESRLDERCASVEAAAETIGAKIRELEQRLSGPSQDVELFQSALVELQGQARLMTGRIAQLEAASPLNAAAERETERARWMAEIDERTVLRIREFGDEIREKLKVVSSLKADLESRGSDAAALDQRIDEIDRGARQFSAALKAEVEAQRTALSAEHDRQQAGEKILEELNQRLGARLSQLETAVQEKGSAGEARLGEVAALEAQMLGLSERVAVLGRRLANDAAQTAAHTQRAQKLEEMVTARLDAIAGQWDDHLHANEIRGVDLSNLGSEVRELAERMDKAELAARQAEAAAAAEGWRVEQTSGRLRAELAGLKAELAEQLKTLSAPQSLIQSPQETTGVKFQELQNQLAQTRHDAEVRDAQLREIGTDVQAMAQRLTDAESFAHRSHALMVNESEQTAQLREGLRIELDALRAQWQQSPVNDARMRGIEENLHLKLREMERRWTQRILPSESREEEIRELKAQVQGLSQGRTSAAAPQPISAEAAPGAANPVDINFLRARREEFTASNPPAEAVAAALPSEASPGVVIAGEKKDQLRQLQDRISADIERARAELREKSGRGRARR